LKPFSAIDCTLSLDIWYPKLIEGLNTEIKHRKQLTEPPSLANGKEYHFVTFIDRESNSKCDNICQVLEELKKDGFIGHILSIEHFSTLECFQVVEEIVLALEKTSKILFFFTREINKKPILSSSRKVGKNVY
jgi:ribosomal protein S8